MPAKIIEPNTTPFAKVAFDPVTRGTIRMQNAFPKLSKTSSTIRRPAPAVPGQDNAEVFAQRLGLDAAELAWLAKGGMIR